MNEGENGLVDLVRDVFISPIRSVLVIDDEFPTLDELLEAKDATSSLKALPAIGTDRLRQILKVARGREIPWLVDVHDGRKIRIEQEEVIAPRLHPSDLMVLDYELQGEGRGGTAAIEIIRKLANNNQFNLVLLYTKGDAGSTVDILRQIALGLTYKNEAYRLSTDENASVINAFEVWDEAENGIADRLGREISDFLFLNMNGRSDPNLKWILEEDGSAQLKEILSKLTPNKQAPTNLVLKWLIEQKQEKLQLQFSNKNLGKIRINAHEDCCWISGERVFVTLLSKKFEPIEFERKIVEAIVSSCPAPHRLLLTKMRSLIDQRGFVAEVDILRDIHVQAVWLHDFLKEDPAEETSVIAATVTRHWEAIGDKLRFELNSFATKLRVQYRDTSMKDVMRNCGLEGVDVLSAETLKKYNCFISTKPLDRGHLTTGVVFHFQKRRKPAQLAMRPGEDMLLEANLEKLQIEEVKEVKEVEYWICLSPACDMVPGQKNKGNVASEISTLLPFTAVRLHTIDPAAAVKKATDNLYIFLKVYDEIQAFSIHAKGDAKTAPEWEQMIAHDLGIFHAETKILPITSITKFASVVATHEVEATVTAQLRSEYALNLLQKLGAQLSRPGLGMHFK